MRRIGRVIALVVAGLAMAAATGWGALVLFYDYMRDINELRERPRFYNTLTTNCTTMILAHAAVNPGSLPYSWKVLLSGYAPEYAYDRGRLDRVCPSRRCSGARTSTRWPRPRTRHPTSPGGSGPVCRETL